MGQKAQSRSKSILRTGLLTCSKYILRLLIFAIFADLTGDCAEARVSRCHAGLQLLALSPVPHAQAGARPP